MKSVDLTARKLSLDQLTRIARRGAVLIRRGRGESLLMTRADDFETAVELLRRNHKFLAFLDRRLNDTRTTTLQEVEAHLGRKAPVTRSKTSRRRAAKPRFCKPDVEGRLRKHDGRAILLRRAGAFADDETLPEMLASIYAKRGRPEVAE